jgi:NAD+-dependent farnesol dehydrogenase
MSAEISLVTGASGFIGSALVKRLSDEGEVRALHRSPAAPDQYTDSAAVECRGDVTDRESLRVTMDGCTQVFHLAGYAKNWARTPQTYWDIHVEGLRNVLDVARELQVRRVVWASTVMTFGPTPAATVCDETYQRPEKPVYTHYEASKMDAEKLALDYVQRYSMDIVTVNPTRVFGPGPLTEGNSLAKIIRDYDRGRAPFLLNGGRNVGNYVYVDDVVQGLRMAMLHGRSGERYLLGGHNRTLLEFFEAIDRVSDKRHFRVTMPWPMALSVAYLMQCQAWLLRIHPPITPPWVRTFLVDWAYSSQKAEDELGYRPSPFEETLRTTYEWLRLN